MIAWHCPEATMFFSKGRMYDESAIRLLRGSGPFVRWEMQSAATIFSYKVPPRAISAQIYPSHFQRALFICWINDYSIVSVSACLWRDQELIRSSSYIWAIHLGVKTRISLIVQINMIRKSAPTMEQSAQ
jgi:hypothetical protein